MTMILLPYQVNDLISQDIRTVDTVLNLGTVGRLMNSPNATLACSVPETSASDL